MGSSGMWDSWGLDQVEMVHWGAGCRGSGILNVGHWELAVEVPGHWDIGLEKGQCVLGVGQLPSPSAGAPTSPRITLGLTRV